MVSSADGEADFVKTKGGGKREKEKTPPGWLLPERDRVAVRERGRPLLGEIGDGLPEKQKKHPRRTILG